MSKEKGTGKKGEHLFIAPQIPKLRRSKSLVSKEKRKSLDTSVGSLVVFKYSHNIMSNYSECLVKKNSIQSYVGCSAIIWGWGLR